MNASSGIPASEQLELLGKLTQADEARVRVRSSAAPLVRQAADKRARRRWMRRRVMRTVRTKFRSHERQVWMAIALPAAVALALVAAWQIRRQPGSRR